jgi:hypothetical protein
VEDLADLFRANLNEKRSRITLKEELEGSRESTNASSSCASANACT